MNNTRAEESGATPSAKGKAGKRKGSGRKGGAGEGAGAAVSPLSLDLRAYTSEFFTLFGAKVTALDRRPHGPLRIIMEGDLAEHFGAAELGLAFQTVEAGSGHQLVAHGSRIFDVMQGWLDKRSALTVRRLPARTAGSDLLLRAIKPLNAGVANLKLAEQNDPLFVFHWRMTYRADDKREELYTVVLDAEGALVVLDGSADGLPPLETLLAESEPAPVQPIQPPQPRSAPAADGTGEPAADHAAEGEAAPEAAAESSERPASSLFVDPDEVPVTSPNGQRLPAMTQLVRLAEQARRYAIYHADLRCVEHEVDILPRLYKSVERLSNYYAQQMEELNSGSVEKHETLQADLARKVSEEVENHRLRVGVQLAGYAVIYRPTAVADLTISDGRREARLRVLLDRYSGHLQRPTCHACGAPVTGAVLCRNGHVACDDCLRQCGACKETLCAACGVEPCSSCGKQLCQECGRSCWACGERACTEHIGRCPVCGDEVCDACRTPCAECGSLQCRSHLRTESVVRPKDRPTPRLICSSCGVRCPGCAQYSARLATCALSGQRFCATCVVTCVGCERPVGPGFYARDNEGNPWCRDCVQPCPFCGTIGTAAVACAQCGRDGCESCAVACEACKKPFCRDHIQPIAGCGHMVCTGCAGACAIGGEPICPKCVRPCAICERDVCRGHRATCIYCRKSYCSDCVEPGAEICRTCRKAIVQGEPVVMANEPCAKDPSVAVLVPLFVWTKAANRQVIIYAGINRTMTILLTVFPLPSGRFTVTSRRLNRNDLEHARRAR